MAGAYPWPVAFSAALAVVRQTFRSLPPAVIRSPSVQRSVQLLANNFTKWPSVTLPAEIRLVPDVIGEQRVRGEWLLPNGRQEIPKHSERLLLWVHGGAFALLSPGTHRRFLAQIAIRADTPVFAVDYRKPPDFAFPVPGEDVLNVYSALRGSRRAERIFLGGDSAGGNLALAASRRIANLGGTLPEGLILLSPWVDLSDTDSDSWRKNRDIDFICQPQSEVLARIYSPNTDLTDVRISPGLEKKWKSWCPPTLLDYGGCESFRSQIELMVASMIKDGVDLDAFEADGMVHCYPLMDFLWGSAPGPFETYFTRVAEFLRR